MRWQHRSAGDADDRGKFVREAIFVDFGLRSSAALIESPASGLQAMTKTW